MTDESIAQEIAMLEDTLTDPLKSLSPDERRAYEIRLTLLRNGYHLEPVLAEPRSLQIVHAATGRVVYMLSTHEVRSSYLSAAGWLKMIQKASEDNARE